VSAATPPDAPAPEPVEVPRQLQVAVAIIALEAVALVAVALLLVGKTLTGHPDSVGRALLDAAFALLGALVLGLCALGLRRGRPAARTPTVVLQLLAIPVSYSLAFQAGRVGYGAPILVAALATLYLLFTPPVRAVLEREPRA
jgi:crotonobetainyl-CoA:carnitine CoA-transferase CaiB-like acyl-CoA transferase